MKGIVYLGGEKLPGHGALELWLRAQIFLSMNVIVGAKISPWVVGLAQEVAHFGLYFSVPLNLTWRVSCGGQGKARKSWALSDGPVIRIPHFHCQGPGFDS